MAAEDLIEANEFCILHHIEYSFIGSLEEVGLVQLVGLRDEKFIQHNQLNKLEKMIRLYQELEVNVAGIEVIINLLEKMEQLYLERTGLKNKISFYERL